MGKIFKAIQKASIGSHGGIAAIQPETLTKIMCFSLSLPSSDAVAEKHYLLADVNL